MLPVTARLRQRTDFAATVRRGRRGRSRLLLVHVSAASADGPATPFPPRVGFVVARSVGAAVVRNRVRRRLRHLMAARLGELPAGVCVVVRALPGAGDAGSAALGEALDRALSQAVPAVPQAGTVPSP